MTKHLRRPGFLPLSQTSIPPPIRNVVFTVSVAILGGLSACSPYAYSDHTQKLSTAMTAIDTAYQQNAQEIVAEGKLSDRLSWIATKPRPELIRGSGCHDTTVTGTVPCTLIIRDDTAAKGDPSPVADPPKPPPAVPPKDVCATPPPASALKPEDARNLPALTQDELLKRLDDYAAALAALTKAQDRTDFNNAAGKLSAAVGGLAKSAYAPAGPIAQASSSMLLWLVGQDLDHRRLQELRISTAAACGNIHILADAAGFILEQQRRNRLRILGSILEFDIHAANAAGANPHATNDEYGAKIEEAQAAADAYEAVRKSDPQATAQALSKAHDELVVAVQNNDGQFDALVAAVETFTAKAHDLAAAAAATPTADKSTKAS